MKNIVYLISTLLLCTSLCAFAAHHTDAQTDDWLYTVNKNDSFELIYKKYLSKRSDILALSKHNRHKLTKKLQPGQVISIPVEMLKKIPTTAQVTLVYGNVMVTTALSDDKRKASKGDLLAQGDALQTGKNSLAKLLFADGSNIDIQPNSNLSIYASFKYVGKETYVTHLKLEKGRTEIVANPEHNAGNTLQVETPAAIAAVRGTEFRVSADGDIALQETLGGQVAFSAAGQAVLLTKGYGSLAEKGKAPLPPILLPDAPDVSTLPKLMDSVPVEFNLLPQQDRLVLVSQLALDADFTQILNEQTVQTDRLSFANLADGQYYLRLRAQDRHGLQSKDAIHAFSVKVRPPETKLVEPKLELIEPLDGTVIPLAPTELNWTPIPNVNDYVIQVARDINFTDIIYERHSSFSRWTIMHSFGAGQYYWRVSALPQGKPPMFSNVRRFSR